MGLGTPAAALLLQSLSEKIPCFYLPPESRSSSPSGPGESPSRQDAVLCAAAWLCPQPGGRNSKKQIQGRVLTLTPTPLLDEGPSHQSTYSG